MKMTKQSQSRKKMSFVLCMVLIAAMALLTTGCNDKTSQEAVQTTSVSIETQVLGEGETKFTVMVVDKEGTETSFEIHTDKKMVGEALQECGLLEGEDGPYGLYVKTVNGITADYDVDQTYWAFYINGEYAMTGVDVTEITEGDSYSLKVEK